MFPFTIGARKLQHLATAIEPANGRAPFPVIEPARYAGNHEKF